MVGLGLGAARDGRVTLHLLVAAKKAGNLLSRVLYRTIYKKGAAAQRTGTGGTPRHNATGQPPNSTRANGTPRSAAGTPRTKRPPAAVSPLGGGAKAAPAGRGVGMKPPAPAGLNDN